MGLSHALSIGRTSLAASDVGVQVTGQNMANAATPGYRRQDLRLAPLGDQRLTGDAFVGSGVQIGELRRSLDEVLLARTRWARAREAEIDARGSTLRDLEIVQGELGEGDVSSSITDFLNSWSNLAVQPEDEALRSVVVREGEQIARRLRDLRADYARTREQLDGTIAESVKRINDLLGQAAELNEAVVEAEQGQGEAGSLRDRRDLVIDELADLVAVTTVEDERDGSVSIFLGSQALLLGSESRDLAVELEDDDGVTDLRVRIASDGSDVTMPGGSLGGMLDARQEEVPRLVGELVRLAGSLIHEVNLIHSRGQGTNGWTDVTGTYGVDAADVPLDDPEAGLPFPIGHGHFVLGIENVSTGSRVERRIDVPLTQTEDPMTLEGLVTAINDAAGDDGVTASIAEGGRLRLRADDGREIFFGADTAGVMAGLGVNTYFTGENAADIGVREELLDAPGRLAVGRDFVEGSNETATAVAALADEGVESLEGRTLAGYWRGTVGDLAARAETTETQRLAAEAVRENLDARLLAQSGVDLDEEALRLVTWQQQYEATARFISTVDELMQVLLSVV